MENNCNIELDLSSIFKNGTKQSWTSNRDFDTFLWNHREQLITSDSDQIVYLDLNEQDEQAARVKRMKKEFDAIKEMENIGHSFKDKVRRRQAVIVSGLQKLAVGIGFSRLYKKVGGDADMRTPVGGYKKKGGSNVAEVEEDPDFDDPTKDTPNTKLGRDGHSIIEAIVKKKPVGKLEILEKKDSDSVYKSMENAAKDAIKEIVRKHTENGIAPHLFSEVPVVAKTIDPKFLDVVHASNLVTSSNSGKITDATPWGIADLIVVDSNGDVFIYDFKFTRNPIEVNSPKNAINEMNLASYGAVTRQYDINVKGLFFVNFNVSWSGDTPTGITFNKGTDVHPLLSNTYVKLANKYYPNTSHRQVESLNDVDTIMSRVIPQNSITNQMEMNKMEVEQELDRVKSVNLKPKIKENLPGVKYIYYMPTTKIPSGINKDWFYYNYLIASSEEQMKERLAVVLDKVNEETSDVGIVMGNLIERAIKDHSFAELRDGIKEITPYYWEALSGHLQPYIDCRWSLVHDETLWSNGILLFQKPSTNQYEIVVLGNHRLEGQIKFNTKGDDSKYADPLRTTILGAFLRDTEVDPMFFMRGFVGNGLLIKGLAWVSANESIFNGGKIRGIKAISIRDDACFAVTNAELLNTWHLLGLNYNIKYPKEPLNLFHTHTLMDDLEKAIEEADDIIESCGEDDIRVLASSEVFKSRNSSGVYRIEDLIKRLDYLNRLYPNLDSSDLSTKLSRIRVALLRGILVYYGTQAKGEQDIGPYWNTGIALEGTMSSSMKESQSVILRQMSTIVSHFYDVYKQEYVTRAAEFQIKYKKFKKVTPEISPILGDEFKYFYNHWFVRDENEKIDKSFSIKPFEDPYWSTCSAEEIAVRDAYFAIWDELRYDDDLEKIQEAKRDGSYYEVPLIKSNFREQLTKSNLLDSIKNWATTFKEKASNLLFNLEQAIYESEQETKLDVPKLPSYILDMYRRDPNTGQTQREKMLKKYGTDKYETDIELVTLTMLAVGMRRKYSEHAMRLTTGLRACAYYEQIVNRRHLPNILAALDMTTLTKMFLKSAIIPQNRGIAALIGLGKGITSATTLIGKWESFARETIKGILDALARTSFDEMYNNKFTRTEYLKALEIVFTSGYENRDTTAFIMQLSHNFGMANFTGTQIVDAIKTNRFSMYQFGPDALYITATWPDFIHRTAFLIAHLMHIGAYEAYSLDEETGAIKYDMTKDKRFQTWLKWRGRESEIPKDTAEYRKWTEEDDKYKELLKDFENAGKVKPGTMTPYEYGDLLPQGISPREQDGLKTVADRLYGNYDKETKSLMQEQLLGALFFQFKTFPLERLSWWFKSPTHINDITYEQQYWEDGEKIVQYFDKEGKWHFGRYGDVDPDWFRTGQAWYYKKPNGHMVFGHLQTVMLGTSYVINHNQAEWEDAWKTYPYFRGQMAIALYDTLFGVLLAFLIDVLMGDETKQSMKDNDWYARWLYTVGTGMQQDGPVWGLMSSIVGDGAPPSLSIIKRYLTTGMSVITGDTSLAYGIANTLGATRNFTSLLTDQ